MLIKSIYLRNFLSYGPNSPEATIVLQDLNVIIGPNASGKSNLLEAFALLKHTPGQIQKPIREGGGLEQWLFKGERPAPETYLSVSLPYESNISDTLHYSLGFGHWGEGSFSIMNEMLYYEVREGEKLTIVPAYINHSGQKEIRSTRIQTDPNLTPVKADNDKSILAQRKDPEQYPEITYLGELFERIQLYRDWTFGRYSAMRQPQKTDLPNEWLEPDASNLALVLNRLRRDYDAKEKLLTALQKLYSGIEDYDVRVEGGTVQVFFQEGRNLIPATRLSDGTLRYLSLLAVLLHPNPPPLVCIEEPELGLHPDILPTIAELLKDASTRMQIIVTTHSDILVDAMTDMPEAVLVCEKTPEGSRLRRLDAEHMKPWLGKYRLGELWISGEIGGTRW
jgi:predicted ATPase